MVQPTSKNYVKGGDPQNLDAAKGGATLARSKGFTKAEDGVLGPENRQDYEKKGKDPHALRTGDKDLPNP